MIDRTKDVIAGASVSVGLETRPTVSATYLRAVVEFAVRGGVHRRELLREVGITEADLVMDDSRLPTEFLIALLRGAAASSGDSAFALRFGDHVPCNEVSLAATLGQAATTVAGAMQQVNRYARLSMDFPSLGTGDRLRLDVDAAGVSIVDLRPVDRWPEITELVFARMARATRRIAGHNVLRALHVTHAAPDHRALYDDLFGVPITYRSTRNALVLDSSYLNTPLTPAPTHVSRILAAEADARLQALDRQRSCRGRVEAVLRPRLRTGDVGMEAVASALAMSRQTLYRTLRAEGVTFEATLEALRHAVAVEQLQTGNMSVREVAATVGFSDPAAFSRAFKRWTGRSPSLIATRT